MLTTQLNLLKMINENFTVLYVEDDIKTHTQTFHTLKTIFPSILTANDAEEGLTLFKKYHNSKTLENIDLIITDIKMPKKDGLCMLKEIKEITPDILTIVTSAYMDTEYFIKAIELGVSSYIIKPFDSEKLTETLYETIKKYLDSGMSGLLAPCPKTEDKLVCLGFRFLL